MHAAESLLIVGASARAAAFSALRAGLRPMCADLFADADLRAHCPVWRVGAKDYPRGFLDLPLLDSRGPWLYTGGLENRPELVEALARRRPLWGNSATVLRRVRSPHEVRGVLRAAGLPSPKVWQERPPPPRDGRWLVKPLAGAGGTGIRTWEESATIGQRRGVYWQELIFGESCAALYVGDGRGARLLGVTRQLVGEAWLHAAPFHYCGSVGPVVPPPELSGPFTDLGMALGRGFGLVGVFGVDCVVRDGVPYPVEVNPRYTASVEVLEYATGLRALALHRRAFDPAAPMPPEPSGATGVVGKAVLFARAALRFPDEGPWRGALADPSGPEVMPAFADIPDAGTPIPAGRPVLTLLCPARTAEECVEELRRRASDLDRRLFGE
ncbi:MAG TPA: ATP-grasp domain-containing protein [Gemmataceae bacterium]|nr:ATP-grasp domain-containing protein [Gemmataceae bacterium]